MPVSFFPSVFESVGRLFMDGVLKQDLSEHYQHSFIRQQLLKGDVNHCKMVFTKNHQEP